ncbi:hypothetical protein COCON_G00109230 [Conger conger]|uniref:Ig-like domain-containing protein n=1 Tax=Conger conger TaxID=82655 RepID=A0A9Q1DJE4_CONCO|nr:hypothetical protein COCON_G00109230 [Conger conger]
MALTSILLVMVYHLVCDGVPLPLVFKKKMGDSVTLPCDGSAYTGPRADQPDVLWQTAEGEKVAHYSHGTLSVSLLFEQRVTFPTDRIRHGDFAITISSLVLSDEDTYQCVWSKGEKGEKLLHDVKLYVLEPSFLKNQAVAAGDPVMLPCYSRVPKKAREDELFVQWKKGHDVILKLTSGEFTYGRNYTERATMSLERIRQGDFSLSLSVVGPHDKGTYQCSNERNQTISSAGLTVSDHQNWVVVETGSTFNLSLPRVPMKLFFMDDGTEVLVCKKLWIHAKCEPAYSDRLVYKQGTLLMHRVNPRDEGRYTVREYYHGVFIKEVHLKVSNDFPLVFYMCSLLLSVCLIALVMKKLRWHPKQMLGYWKFCLSIR